MNEPAELVIGIDTSCRDGACGLLQRIVVDPAALTVTHLVIQPSDRPDQARLVPIELLDTTEFEVRLRCTVAEFDGLERAEETVDLSAPRAGSGPASNATLLPPYYGLATDSLGMGSLGMTTGPGNITVDRVPEGEAEVHRGERVHATNGDIGRLQGLIIDRHNNHVTHVLLDEGHLWGEKRVAIPVNAVEDVRDGVRLNLTKDQVRDLPTFSGG